MCSPGSRKQGGKCHNGDQKLVNYNKPTEVERWSNNSMDVFQEVETQMLTVQIKTNEACMYYPNKQVLFHDNLHLVAYS